MLIFLALFKCKVGGVREKKSIHCDFNNLKKKNIKEHDSCDLCDCNDSLGHKGSFTGWGVGGGQVFK